MFSASLIDAARGSIPCDTNFANCRVLDVFTGTIGECVTVSVHEGHIVGVGTGLAAKATIDLGGMTIAPGFWDAHVHIESTLLSPPEYAKQAMRRGVTGAVADPHEIANVLGYDGIVWMLKASEGLPMDIRFMMPSCVPATSMETSGAVLHASDMLRFLSEPRVLGLGEMMNYPGVLMKDPEVLDKIALFAHAGKPVDGHAPGLSGKDLAAYALAGIGSDHEATTPAEAIEKIKAGMWIMVREGSGARDLEKLIPAINSRTASRMMICADDRHTDDLALEGYVDRSVRILIEAGVDATDAYLMGSWNACRYFGMKDSGAIAPGYRATFNVLSDFSRVKIEAVYASGEKVAQGGEILATAFPEGENLGAKRAVRDSVNIKLVSEEDFRIEARDGKKARIMEARPKSIVTGTLLEVPKAEGGFVVADLERDILKMFVIERHLGSGNIGKGLIRGFGMKRGAIATTVTHDSHNMIVVGADDESIFKAVRHLNKLRGGMAVVEGNRVLADLPLPVAGLMSDSDAETVIAALGRIEHACGELGITLPAPFMTLSFMALPVIPELKLTDKGLVDVLSFKGVPLFEE